MADRWVLRRNVGGTEDHRQSLIGSSPDDVTRRFFAAPSSFSETFSLLGSPLVSERYSSDESDDWSCGHASTRWSGIGPGFSVNTSITAATSWNRGPRRARNGSRSHRMKPRSASSGRCRWNSCARSASRSVPDPGDTAASGKETACCGCASTNEKTSCRLGSAARAEKTRSHSAPLPPPVRDRSCGMGLRSP